ncbi:MAG: ABC transporter substrate-binding protein [Actinobacteria bacterium]|nr:ABC transporter substrate-binding protein [Actinomycetota bacterium]
MTILGLAATAALIAGCGSSSSAGSGGGGSPKSGGEPIHLGVVASLSGAAAPFGKTQVQGAELAAEEWNAKHPDKIELSVQDDQSEAKGGVSAMRKLSEEGPDAIVGPTSTTIGVAIAPIATQEQIPMMSPSVSAPEFVSEGGYTFRNHLTTPQQAAATTEWAVEGGIKSVGMLMNNAADGKAAAETVEEIVEENGGQITGAEFAEPTAVEFQSQLTKLVAGKPEALWVFIIAPEAIALAMKEARQLGFTGRFLTIANVETEEFTETVGSAGEEAVWAVETEPEAPSYAAFVAAYKKKFGAEPEFIAANSYDATMLLAEGITKVGGGSALREWLHKAHYEGVTGPISFDAEGDVTERPLAIRELRGGKFVDAGGK